MSDLVIRGGDVADGTGEAKFQADIAISDGYITEIGKVTARGKREIDAHGLVVTPGFIDLHTHYDGQVMWDPLLTSSCWHGVTTAVLANCGIGFAPVPKAGRDWLIRLLEGVEDVPAEVLNAGIDWDWESFPDYLDSISRREKAMDVAAQVAHAPVRALVMGERAPTELATEDDITAMVQIVEEAMAAGAFGFSTGRMVLHKSKGGEMVPGTFASEAEVFALGSVLKRCGRGLLQITPGGPGTANVEETFRAELDMMARLAAEIRRPVVYTGGPKPPNTELWKESLVRGTAANEAGAPLFAMFTSRPATAILLGLETPGTTASPVSYLNPFRHRPTYKELLLLEDREAIVARLRDPAMKARILAEAPDYEDAQLAAGMEGMFGGARLFDNMFRLAEPINYQFDPATSVGAMAQAAGITAEEGFYDSMLEDEGRRLFYMAGVRTGDNLILEAMTHPYTIPGLGDGGAHVQNLCDSSQQTSAITYWSRDCAEDQRLPLEFIVRRMSSDPAALGGLVDRGQIKVGMKADINVIDFENMKLRAPVVVKDLPSHGRRVIQRAEGYVATVVAGTVIIDHDEETGERPGELVRLHTLKAPA